jgi:flagellar motor component MotA
MTVMTMTTIMVVVVAAAAAAAAAAAMKYRERWGRSVKNLFRKQEKDSTESRRKSRLTFLTPASNPWRRAVSLSSEMNSTFTQATKRYVRFPLPHCFLKYKQQ